ncbi:uncharacterized protein LOC124255501 [Haliotis rubra]|uniref:uncharacterized protein LOC124255501 n=1 Tax=Haliotis rubra TaxID=36100 RepID=UPI001EE4F208|nr:uncharacterized protein LOC124255501 [Haliotis rubra]
MAAGPKTEVVPSSGFLQSTLLVVMAIQTCSSTPYLMCPGITTPGSTANLTCTRLNFTESLEGALVTVCHLYNGTCTTPEGALATVCHLYNGMCTTPEGALTTVCHLYNGTCTTPEGALATVCHLYNGTCTTPEGALATVCHLYNGTFTTPEGALATVCHLYNGTCTTRDDGISAYVFNTTTSVVTTLTLGGYWLCVEAPDPCNIPVGEPPADHTTAIAAGIIVGVVMVTAILVFCRMKRAIRAYSQTPKSFDSTSTNQTLDA